MPALGCTPHPLLERAIRARGGPLGSIIRDVEADVHAGFPGTWRWQTAFMLPDRYDWTIFTTGEPDHYLFDGTTVRAFIGSGVVTADADRAAPLRTHARFTAVMNLDALRLPGARVQSLPAADLPPGTTAGLTVVLADDGARYRLAFDDRALLVWVTGPLALPPLGQGELIARFGDFRRAGGLLLPFRAWYTFRGAALADERTLAACPNPPGLSAEAFRTPGLVPRCG